METADRWAGRDRCRCQSLANPGAHRVPRGSRHWAGPLMPRVSAPQQRTSALRPLRCADRSRPCPVSGGCVWQEMQSEGNAVGSADTELRV